MSTNHLLTQCHMEKIMQTFQHAPKSLIKAWELCPKYTIKNIRIWCKQMRGWVTC